MKNEGTQQAESVDTIMKWNENFAQSNLQSNENFLEKGKTGQVENQN